MGIEGKVVAISGTSGGIGRTLAEVFAERGAMVVGCARNSAKGEKVAAGVAEKGGTMTFVTADVTSRNDCYRFIDTAVSQHGRIDVLINNAGGSYKWLPTESVPEDEFNSIIQLNLNGPLFCAQRAIQDMKRRGESGAILSIASVNAVLTSAMTAAYNSAKAALIALSNTIAVEYLDAGIRSNIILMGGAPTAAAAGAVREMTRVLKGEGAEPDWTQYMPTPLTGTPLRDIATATAALASDDCKAITGATIAIDQGQSIGALHSQATFLALSGGWRAPQD